MNELIQTLLFFLFIAAWQYFKYKVYSYIESKRTIEELLAWNIEVFNARYKNYKEKMKNYDYYVKCKQNEWHMVEWQYREYKYLRDFSVKNLYEEFKKEEIEIRRRYE